MFLYEYFVFYDFVIKVLDLIVLVMPWKHIPVVTSCCDCVTDLKSATAIIAVLGIVTSPALSWAVVRHSYIIRVSCTVAVAEARPDVVDISFTNVLSFGFGSNAGLGPSCLGPLNKTSSLRQAEPYDERTDPRDSKLVIVVQVVGWIVLAIDLAFIITCAIFLYRLFHPRPSDKSLVAFIWICSFLIFFSFVYGVVFIAACITTGGSFPLYELLFTFFDALLWIMWIYLLYTLYLIYQGSKVKNDVSVNESRYSYLRNYFSGLVLNHLPQFLLDYLGFSNH